MEAFGSAGAGNACEWNTEDCNGGCTCIVLGYLQRLVLPEGCCMNVVVRPSFPQCNWEVASVGAQRCEVCMGSFRLAKEHARDFGRSVRCSRPLAFEQFQVPGEHHALSGVSTASPPHCADPCSYATTTSLCPVSQCSPATLRVGHRRIENVYV